MKTPNLWVDAPKEVGKGHRLVGLGLHFSCWFGFFGTAGKNWPWGGCLFSCSSFGGAWKVCGSSFQHFRKWHLRAFCKSDLVGGWTTHLKNESNWVHLPQGRDEKKTYLKPPPSDFLVIKKHHKTSRLHRHQGFSQRIHHYGSWTARWWTSKNSTADRVLCATKVIRLMVQKSNVTTWHVWNPQNNGTLTISTGAGFLPSTGSRTWDQSSQVKNSY